MYIYIYNYVLIIQSPFSIFAISGGSFITASGTRERSTSRSAIVLFICTYKSVRPVFVQPVFVQSYKVRLV